METRSSNFLVHRWERTAAAGLLALLFVHPLLRACWDLWAQTLVHLLSAACLLAGCVVYAGRPGRIKLHAPAIAAAAVFLGSAAGLVSAVLSRFPASSFPAFLNDLNGAVFFLGAFWLSQKPDADRTNSLWIALAAPIALLSVAHILAHLLFWTGLSPDPARLYINANVLAGYHVLTLPLFAAKLRAGSLQNGRGRWLYAALFGIAAASLLLTRSVLGIAVAALQIALIRFSGRISAKAAARAAAYLVPALLIGLAAAFAAKANDPLQSQRIDWAAAGLRMFLDNPLWGAGPGTFGEAFPGYRGNDILVENTVYAHNFLLEWLAERGLVGALLTALPFGLALRAVFRGRKGPPSELVLAGGAGLGGFLFFNGLHFAFSIPSLQWTCWFLAGLILSETTAPAEGPRLPSAAAAGLAVAALALTIPSLLLFRSDQHLARARHRAADGAWPTAMGSAEKALRWNPYSHEAHAIRAEGRAREGRWPEAIDAVDRALRLSPFSWRYYSQRAVYSLSQGGLRSAFEDFERAAGYNPLDSWIWLQVGELSLRLEMPDRARRAFGNIVELNERLYPRMHTLHAERRRQILETAVDRLHALGGPPGNGRNP